MLHPQAIRRSRNPSARMSEQFRTRVARAHTVDGSRRTRVSLHLNIGGSAALFGDAPPPGPGLANPARRDSPPRKSPVRGESRFQAYEPRFEKKPVITLCITAKEAI